MATPATLITAVKSHRGPLILLDQMALDRLTRDPARAERFRHRLKDADVRLGIDLAHVAETAGYDGELRDARIELVSSLPQVHLRPFAWIGPDEIQIRIWKVWGMNPHGGVLADGDVLQGEPGLSFPELVARATARSLSGKSILLHGQAWQESIERTYAERDEKLGRESITLSPLKLFEYEADELKKCFLADDFLWETKEEVKIPPGAERRRVLSEIKLTSCPYLCAYAWFQTLRYRALGRKKMSGDLQDAEHALHAAVVCHAAVLDGNAVDVLRQFKKQGAECKAKLLKVSEDWESDEFFAGLKK